MIWGLIYRALVLLSGGALILVLPYTTAIDEQGIYYALLGIISLYMVADLGLASAIINFVSHQSVSFDAESLEGAEARANLKKILLFSVKWVFAGGAFFIPVSILLLSNIHQSNASLLGNVSFTNLVIFVCLACFLCFVLYIGTAFVEGMGDVSNTFMIRSIFLGLNIILQITLLFLGFSFLSLPIAQTAAATIAVIFLVFKYRKQFKVILKAKAEGSSLSIRNELAPFQGKVAISWLFGFLPIQMLPTVTIVTLGAEWAARLGMTQQIVTAVSATAFLFVQFIVPKMGGLAAQGKSEELYRMFKKASFKSLIASLFFMISSIAVLYVLSLLDMEFYDRLLPLDLFVLFASLMIVNWYFISHAALGRVFHKEIMLVPTMISGTFVGLLYSVSNMLTPELFVVAYVSISWLVLTMFAFTQFKRFLIDSKVTM